MGEVGFPSLEAVAVRDGKFEIASDIEGYKELTIDEPTDSPHPRPIGNAPPASW